MHRLRNQLTITAVAVLLGLLVVVQIRAQNANEGLAGRSAQELTLLVANLNTRNDQLRREIASLEREADQVRSASERGETNIGQLRIDLARIRAWSGLELVSGPGVRITVSGPIAGPGIEELLNELRNSGAEAISVAGTRIVPGVVVAGGPGELAIDGERIVDPFDIDAIGLSDTLTGALTRVGGVVTLLNATYPEATLTVTPLKQLDLPATTRDLTPAHGHPRL